MNEFLEAQNSDNVGEQPTVFEDPDDPDDDFAMDYEEVRRITEA